MISAFGVEHTISKADRGYRAAYIKELDERAKKTGPKGDASKPFLHRKNGTAGEGRQAPEKIRRALSGSDPGDTLKRIGRATTKHNVEFSAKVHPISGRVLAMSRGNGHTVQSPEPARSAAHDKMRSLMMRTRNTEVRQRAYKALNSRSGPQPISVHTHPLGSTAKPSGGDIAHAQATNASHAVLAREGKKIRVTHYRIADAKKAAHAPKAVDGSYGQQFLHKPSPAAWKNVGVHLRSAVVKSAFGIQHSSEKR